MMDVLDRLSREAPVVIDASALVDKRSGKPKRISRQMRRVIQGMRDGKYLTIVAAAQNEGLNEKYISRALRLPHVRAYIDSLTSAHLQGAKLRAAGRLVELIDSESAHVSFDASIATLGINGIHAQTPSSGVTVNVNTNVSPGYVVDLTPTLPTITVEPNESSEDKA